MVNFDQLPEKIVVVIAGFLDGVSFTTLSTVCKKLRALIKDQSIWRTLLHSSYKFKDSLYLESVAPTAPRSLLSDITEYHSPKYEVDWKKIFVDTRNHDRMKWKLNQVFGEDPSSVNEENIITTVEFDSTGEFLSIGYQCGQVVVFRNTTSDTYKFFTQFESHHPEFDFLTSLEIEEKINKVRWVKNKYNNNSRLMLTTNDKTIKLFKMFEKKPKKYTDFKSVGVRNQHTENNNGHFTPIQPSNSSSTEVVQRKVFANAHAYNINSISLCSDGQMFLSGDDLRINLWNLETSKECFTIVDTKPSNMNELSEVLTAAEFHPSEPHNFIFSSSKGFVYMGDMRKQALCDKTVKVFREKEGGANKSFFSEVTSSISDVRYSSSGRYIIARDYLHIKIWDVNMESEPIKVYNVHDHLRAKLYELYENDNIFDKFELCRSNNDMHFLTGSYSNNFMIFDIATAQVKYMQATNPRDRKKKKQTTLPTVEDINFHEKVSHVAWHPKSDLVAIAAGNYIYLYHLTK